MRNLGVWIEIGGLQTYVGRIIGEKEEDARFSYAEEYLSGNIARPISIHLPLSENAFSVDDTRNFFEGLLPEGFTRRCVAGLLHTDANNYLSLLAGLGNECLGAIKITDENNEVVNENNKDWYLPKGAAPSTHIVKQSHVRLDGIVTNEQLCMMTAGNMGIEIPESFIVNVGDGRDEEVLLATKRYDRAIKDGLKKINGLSVPYRLHQEDFSQAMGISAHNKYESDNAGYLKMMFEIIRQKSFNPIADQLKMWDICIFNYLIGNTDNHIKNVSLLYDEELKTVRLAPAYDILSTVIYTSSTRDMAFSIGNEYDIKKITRDSFRREAANIGLGEQMAMKRFDYLANAFPDALNKACDELLGKGFNKAIDIYERIRDKRREFIS